MCWERKLNVKRYRHTYCETCIYQAHEASSVCPVDRSAFTLKDIKPAVKIIRNMVNELNARCPRSEHGCGYVGQRQFMESHVKNDCLFTFAPCNMNECKALVLKKDLVTHIATCKYRHVECKMCKRKIRAFELEVNRTKKTQLSSSKKDAYIQSFLILSRTIIGFAPLKSFSAHIVRHLGPALSTRRIF